MEFYSPLCKATLIRRYKRFLADMRLSDGREVTVHCPNPGAMTGMADPGMTCWLAPAAKSAKLDWGWKLVEVEQGLAAVDTGLANKVVAEALAARAVPGLPDFTGFRAEVALDATSRIDFRLESADGPIWLEVKSVTLARGRLAAFPDTKTERGAKHLRALSAAVASGERAVMLYLLARNDCDRIGIAGDIDPAYAAAFEQAQAAGVQMIGLSTEISPAGIRAGPAVPVG